MMVWIIAINLIVHAVMLIVIGRVLHRQRRLIDAIRNPHVVSDRQVKRTARRLL